jgi:hypothetical protein
MSRPVGESRRLKVARQTHHSAVKRLWCPTHGSMQDAQKVVRSAGEYKLDCGCVRLLMSSEAVQARQEEAGHGAQNR